MRNPCSCCWSGLYLCDSLSCCRESSHQADCSSSICLTLQLAIWHLDHSVGDLGHNTLHAEYFIITRVTHLQKQYWYRCFTFALALSEVGHCNWHTGPIVNLKTRAGFCLDIDQFACAQWQQNTFLVDDFSTIHYHFTFHVILITCKVKFIWMTLIWLKKCLLNIIDFVHLWLFSSLNSTVPTIWYQIMKYLGRLLTQIYSSTKWKAKGRTFYAVNGATL